MATRPWVPAAAGRPPQAPSRTTGAQGRSLASVLAALLLLTAGAGVLVDRVFRPDAFPVENIRIVGGSHHLDPSAVERTVLPLVRGNLFALDLRRIAAAAETVPWTYRATVHRRWPRTVEIRLEEQHLLARWASDGWLNRDGDVVAVPQFDDRELPVLSGPSGTHREMLTRYRQWSRALSASGLQIDELVLTARRAWKARLLIVTDAIDGESDARELTVIIGKHDADARLSRFARVYAGVDNDIWSQAAEVDLRYPNGFAVRWRDDGRHSPQRGPDLASRRAARA